MLCVSQIVVRFRNLSCSMNSLSDSFEKLKYVGSVAQENFYSNLKKSRISKEDNEMFLKQLFYRGYVNIKVLLKAHNLAETTQFNDTMKKEIGCY